MSLTHELQYKINFRQDARGEGGGGKATKLVPIYKLKAKPKSSESKAETAIPGSVQRLYRSKCIATLTSTSIISFLF